MGANRIDFVGQVWTLGREFETGQFGVIYTLITTLTTAGNILVFTCCVSLLDV